MGELFRRNVSSTAGPSWFYPKPIRAYFYITNTNANSLTITFQPGANTYDIPATSQPSFGPIESDYFTLSGSGTVEVIVSTDPVSPNVQSISSPITASVSGSVTASISNTVAVTSADLLPIAIANGTTPPPGWIHFILAGSGAVPTVAIGASTYNLNNGAQLQSPNLISDDLVVDGTVAITFGGCTVVTLTHTTGVD